MNNLEILRKFVSTQGYKKDSPDKNNPINIIPSNQITMENVEFPVIGVDNLGNQILMQPGQDYVFDGNYVTEFPIRQQGGQMNEEIMNQVAQAIQQGANPDEIVQALIQQGLGEPEAMQLVNNVMSQLETQLPQAQYGMQVTNHNKVSNLNFDNKFNSTALGLNMVSDPRNLTWALPDKGIGSGFKAISGLASGLTGAYLGYAKMFSKDKTTDITPTSAINKTSSAQIQAPYMNTDSEKALPTPWGKEQTPPDWLNPYNGTPDIQGTNQYSTYQKGGSKYGLNAYSKIQKEALDKSLKEKKLSQTDYEIIKHHKSGLIKPYKDGWEYDMKNLYNSPNVEGTTDEQQFFTEWYNNPITINKYDKYNIPNSMSVNYDVIDNNINKLNIKPSPDIPNLYVSNKGNYDPYAHTIWGMKNSRAHEVSHGTRIAYFPISQSIIQSVLKNETHTQDPDNYYTDPDEIYARINSLRYKYNLKPGQVVTKEFLDNQNWQQELDDLKNHFTEKGILNLFNELAQNNTKTPSDLQYAQQGGMKKYQFAGQTIDDVFPYESSQKQITYGQPGRNRYDAVVDGYPNNTNQQYNTNPYFYTLPIAEYVANAQNIGNMDFTGNSMMNDGKGLNFSNSSNPSNKTSEQLKKEKKYITSRGDSLGFQVANNALIGFQNFNDVLSAKDYEKEYNQMLIDTGNTDQRYNTNNPTNPYGTYTPNVGIGSNYGLVANGPIQDFGTGKFGGMKKKYKEGGQYTLSQEEIDYIINNGGEIEFID